MVSDSENGDVLKKMDCVPVRKSPVEASWDLYLLYGVESPKRNSVSENAANTIAVTYKSMCLSKAEMEENSFMVVKTKSSFSTEHSLPEHSDALRKEGFLFVKDATPDAPASFSEEYSYSPLSI